MSMNLKWLGMLNQRHFAKCGSIITTHLDGGKRGLTCVVVATDVTQVLGFGYVSEMKDCLQFMDLGIDFRKCFIIKSWYPVYLSYLTMRCTYIVA